MVASRSAVVLWIDPDRDGFNRAVSDEMCSVAAKSGLSLTVVSVSSSAEARSWLLRDAAAVRALIAADRLRVITNRYRKDDGDELAGVQWIDWMRAKEQRQYQWVPVMLYCSQDAYPRVAGLHDPVRRRVVVTASEERAVEFAAFRLAFAPPPQQGLLASWWSGAK